MKISTTVRATMKIATIEAKRQKYDRMFKGFMNKSFRLQRDKILKIEYASNAELRIKAMEIIDKDTPRVFNGYLKLWVSIADEFGRFSYNFLANQKAFSIASLYFSITNLIFGRVNEVQAFTKRNLGRIIDTAITEGLSIPKTSNLISKAFCFSKKRSQRIARTEVNSASNYGSVEGAKQTGLTLKKVWLSTADKRTRKTHKKANRQAVGMNEKFKVGGVRLEFPGDPKGPGRETINCRCTVTYKRL